MPTTDFATVFKSFFNEASRDSTYRHYCNYITHMATTISRAEATKIAYLPTRALRRAQHFILNRFRNDHPDVIAWFFGTGYELAPHLLRVRTQLLPWFSDRLNRIFDVIRAKRPTRTQLQALMANPEFARAFQAYALYQAVEDTLELLYSSMHAYHTQPTLIPPQYRAAFALVRLPESDAVNLLDVAHYLSHLFRPKGDEPLPPARATDALLKYAGIERHPRFVRGAGLLHRRIAGPAAGGGAGGGTVASAPGGSPSRSMHG